MLIIRKKEMENTFMKMVNIIQDNLKMVQNMEKEQNIIQMEILIMKMIGLMMNQKEMENVFMKMMNIIQDNLKLD